MFARLGGNREIVVDHAYTFKEEEIYPNKSDGNTRVEAPQVSIDVLLKRWAKRSHEIRIIMGHFPFCTVNLLGAEFTTLSILREPVERTLSFLRFHRKAIPADKNRPLEDIYDEHFRFRSLVHNHMVKMFSLTVDEMTAGMYTHADLTPEHLNRAINNLETVDVLGIQENFELFCSELESKFGWQLGKSFHAMATDKTEVPKSFRKRIASENPLDVEFYEYARQLVAKRQRK